MSGANPSSNLIWLITGTSVGLGKELAFSALKRGDKVIATARTVSKLKDLREAGAATLQLDVTDSLENLKKVADEAIEIYGRVDVLVNNAGYAASGALEENTTQETFDQFNTNVFGVLNVSRAFLPHMRERKSGTIIMLGSMVGWFGLVNCGLYVGTKFAVRGLADSLNQEISPLGLRCICIEPGGFRTNFLTQTSHPAYDSRIPDYYDTCKAAEDALMAGNCKQPGDPKKLTEVVVDIIRREGVAKGRNLPVCIPLGSDAYQMVEKTCKDTLANLESWKDVIVSTDFPKGT